MDDVKHLFSSTVEYKFNKVEQDIITTEIQKLLQLQVISITERQ